MEFMNRLLDNALPTHGETLAFSRGKACGLKLTRASEVAENCFYRDPQHPLRQAGSAPPPGAPR